MGEFIIKPKVTQNPRMYDDAFLWKDSSADFDLYIMVSHRLALYCWLQCEKILEKEHSLIFIDQHADAREWFDDEAPKLEKILEDFKSLSDYKIYNSFQCVNRNKNMDGRETRTCVTWGNFLYLTVKAKLFKHYYLYSPAPSWDIDSDMKSEPKIFDLYQKLEDINSLDLNIKKSNNKCIVDIDLDFFDNVDKSDDILENIFETIKKNKASISCVTISLNLTPDYNEESNEEWDKRQKQLEKIKEIFGIDIPIPIVKSGEWDN